MRKISGIRRPFNKSETIEQNEWQNKRNFSTNSLIPKKEERNRRLGRLRKTTSRKPEFPLIRRILLGADSVVHISRLRAFETNKRRMAKYSESMDPCFISRIVAVLQFTQFAYAWTSRRGEG